MVTEQQPIVAVIGTAGSRQSLEMFFRNLPADSGIIYVVTVRVGNRLAKQLPTILQNRTDMPVVLADDSLNDGDIYPKLDHIYWAPAGLHVAIVGGQVRLQSIAKATAARDASVGSLDNFLTSLAATYHTAAAAVVLSGTGTDGVSGLQHICNAGGMVFIQDPDEAAHGALPRRAVAACPNAKVATAGELARLLVQAKGDLADAANATGTPVTFDDSYINILQLIALQTGHDLSHYKASTLQRRIARRMAITGAGDLASYIALLKSTTAETHALFSRFSGFGHRIFPRSRCLYDAGARLYSPTLC
ncbi:MAG: chemotaxis protein CheB [Caldilineaceae bacterium]